MKSEIIKKSETEYQVWTGHLFYDKYKTEQEAQHKVDFLNAPVDRWPIEAKTCPECGDWLKQGQQYSECDNCIESYQEN